MGPEAEDRSQTALPATAVGRPCPPARGDTASWPWTAPAPLAPSTPATSTGQTGHRCVAVTSGRASNQTGNDGGAAARAEAMNLADVVGLVGVDMLTRREIHA
jgi:hypothetical protein